MGNPNLIPSCLSRTQRRQHACHEPDRLPLLDIIAYPDGGGLMWVYLQLALGLREAGAKVIWMEAVNLHSPTETVIQQANIVENRIAKYGLDDSMVIFRGDENHGVASPGLRDPRSGDARRIVFKLRYGLTPLVVKRFKKSALVDIDPGMTQIWTDRAEVKMTPHDFYFTIGETIGKPG